MDALEELTALVRTGTISGFVREHPGPYLLRYLSQEERERIDAEGSLELLFDEDGVTNRGLHLQEVTNELTAAPVSSLTVDPAQAFGRITEPLRHFACYPIVKSARNVFPYGPTLGRTRNNDIVVPLSVVSKFHSWFQRQGETLYMYDANSRFGTFVNGVQLPSSGEAGLPLRPGANVRVGDVQLMVVEAASLFSWISLRLKTT